MSSDKLSLLLALKALPTSLHRYNMQLCLRPTILKPPPLSKGNASLDAQITSGSVTLLQQKQKICQRSQSTPRRFRIKACLKLSDSDPYQGLLGSLCPKPIILILLREALIFQELRSPQGPTNADLLKIYQRSPSPTQECRMKRIPKARPTIYLENL
jgi:hypothetical protein